MHISRRMGVYLKLKYMHCIDLTGISSDTFSTLKKSIMYLIVCIETTLMDLTTNVNKMGYNNI